MGESPGVETARGSGLAGWSCEGKMVRNKEGDQEVRYQQGQAKQQESGRCELRLSAQCHP